MSFYVKTLLIFRKKERKETDRRDNLGVIYCEVSVLNRPRRRVSTGIETRRDLWDTTRKLVRGNTPKAQAANEAIRLFCQQLVERIRSTERKAYTATTAAAVAGNVRRNAPPAPAPALPPPQPYSDILNSINQRRTRAC